MSLSGVLAKTADGLDNDLDAIFQSSAGPSNSLSLASKATAETSKKPTKSERKRLNGEEHEKSKKKVRVDTSSSTVTEKEPSELSHKKKGSKARNPKTEVKTTAESTTPDSADNDVDHGQREDGSESDSSAVPVHESLSKKTKKSSKKPKFVPEDESAEQRDFRTIFVGNLPAEIVKNRSLSKKLKRHITELVPQSSIESIRFRSVPFQNPTSKLDLDDKSPSKKEAASHRDERDKKRTADWREEQNNKKGADDEAKSDEKKYMTPGQKRRLAAIKGEVHDGAARVNAYIVFSHPTPPELRPSNIPYKEVMDPFEAAKAAVAACNGTTFEGHTIHVDHVGKAPQQQSNDGSDTVQADPKRSIFVGNLDFAAAEDDVRAFFEAAMCTERGSAPEASDDTPGVAKTWVVNVRIIRDKETQLGKGFAYVQFSDRECVDEILSLEQSKLLFAKRTLRIQRCKTLPGSKIKVAPGKAVTSPAKEDAPKDRKSEMRSRSSTSKPVEIPKGDPRLGEKLAGLSKEKRKEAKARDADRVARRLAKKKARNELEKSGVKVRDDLKTRVRERKKGGGTMNTGKKTGKPRIRSDRAAKLKNVKKQ